MNFHRKNRSGKKVIVYIVIITLALAFVYLGFLQPVISVVSAPFIYIGDVSSGVLNKAKSAFISPQKIVEENRILKEQVDRLNFQNSQKVDQEEELGIADVLVRPSRNIYGTLLVKSRDNQKVEVGDVILSKNGVYLGLVEEVNFARVSVRLTSHPGFSSEFSVERSGIPIRIVGVGGGNMKAELPKGSDIIKSDTVVDLESGRVVAEVGEINADEASAFMEVYLRMPVNIFEITEVFIAES